MKEKLIEQKFKREVERIGGMALKFTSPAFTGVPDRIALLPNGRFAFAETKSSVGKLSPRQKIVFAMLEKLGFKVWIVSDETTLQEFLNWANS